MESERIVLERIDFLKLNCEIMKQLVPASVKVKEQNKRWGSCTAQKYLYKLKNIYGKIRCNWLCNNTWV